MRFRLSRKKVEKLTHIALPEVVFFYRGLSRTGLQNLYRTKASLETSILDVGGGNGSWAYQLKQCGFNRVSCVDKYCPKCQYDDVDFVNGEIFDINEKYDIITFNHSFEHMENPIDVLIKV